jgi:NADPH:quinone reductase-like Zn-dependent oxidoreductase
VVVDLVGGDVLERSWSTVAPGGVVVSAMDDPEATRPGATDARGVYFVVEPVRGELDELARRVDTGQLRPVVGEVFDLADGRRAFEAKKGGGVPGKVVLRVP